MSWWFAALVVGCDRADPELVAKRHAAQAWVAGRDKLRQGDVAGARASFAEARSHTEHALLVAWDAQAAADGGELQLAIELSEEALVLDPGLAEARYNRAVYLVRAGRPEQAGPELQRAIADGAARALEAFEDPDFADVRGLPAFDFLPKAALVAQVRTPEPSAFLGSEIVVAMSLQGLVRPPLIVEAQAATGPVELVSVSETWPSRESHDRVDLEWTWRVRGAGAVALGPFNVSAGQHTTTAPAIQVEAAAPEGAESPEVPKPTFPVPSTLGAGLAAAGAVMADGALVVRAASHDRVRVDPDPGGRQPVRMEFNEGAQTRWVLHRYAPGPSPERVVVTAPDGTVRFEGPPDVVTPTPRR